MNYRKDFEPKRRNKTCRPDGRHVLNNQGTDDYVLTDIELFLANCSREERDAFIDRMLAYMRKLMTGR